MWNRFTSQNMVTNTQVSLLPSLGFNAAGSLATLINSLIFKLVREDKTKTKSRYEMLLTAQIIILSDVFYAKSLESFK